MLNSSARRVALTGVCLAAVIGVAGLTGACGVRPTAAVGEPVIIPQATTTSASSTQPQPSPEPPPAENPANQPPAGGSIQLNPQPLVAAATEIEPNTTLGAVVYDRVAGTELLAVEPDRQFRSASLVKLMIAIDALRSGAASRKQIARMLSLSDDKIASELWVQDGGPRIVKRTAELIGLQATEPPEADIPGKWGEVRVTAHDMVRVYQYVMDGMAPEDHTLIVDALAQAPEYAADDFRQYFGIPDGLNAQWAIKQGWGNNDHTMVLHSTGLVGAKWRYVVVLLTEHPIGSGWSTSAKSVTAAAAALNLQLGSV